MTYAGIMVINLQICVLSDFITLGNRELLFRSHNEIYLGRGQPVRFSTYDNTNHDFRTMPEYFNNYFLSITGKPHNVPNTNDNFAAYLYSTCNEPYPNINAGIFYEFII
jgi:hypothetical protein